MFSLRSLKFRSVQEVLRGMVTVFLILDHKEAYLPNLKLLACLNPSKKYLWVVVVVGGDGAG